MYHNKARLMGTKSFFSKERMILGLFFIMTSLLTSCSSLLSPVKLPEKTYIINTIPCPDTKRPSHRILLVTQSDPNPVYNTTMMAYSICPYQLAYFAKNAWVATPPQMLQPLIVQTLQNTHHFKAVLSSSTEANYDYILNVQLLQLEQQFYRCSSDVYLSLRAQLINASNDRVIAAKQFCVVEPAPRRNPYGGVIAANIATARILEQLAQFVLRHS